MKHDDEVVEIIPEPFENLDECVSYYLDILGNIKEAENKELLNKKEYKKKHKFIMTQFDENLKLIKKKDNTRISREEKKLKGFKVLGKDKESEKIDRVDTAHAISPSADQYQIEDAKEKK